MDGDKALIAFAEAEGIEYELIIASKGEHVHEKVLHIQNVNAFAVNEPDDDALRLHGTPRGLCVTGTNRERFGIYLRGRAGAGRLSDELY
jgi:hypothetical protein